MKGTLASLNFEIERPVFVGWRFENSITTKIVGFVKCPTIVFVLSDSVVNPFKTGRLRKVLTLIGVGYVWETELSHEFEEEEHTKHKDYVRDVT